MRPAVMPDHDIEGQFQVLLSIWTGDPWGELWRDMEARVARFADLGLAPDAADQDVWQHCQDAGVILLTGNRNNDGPGSLEATITRHRTSVCLPVFTIARPGRVLIDRGYAERVAEAVFELLLDIDRLRGIGRLYVP